MTSFIFMIKMDIKSTQKLTPYQVSMNYQNQNKLQFLPCQFNPSVKEKLV